MTSIALSTHGLTKSYGDRTVVDNLNLSVPTGVVAGFVGPNGAGKTTTMAMLLGLVRPTSGTAEVFGASVTQPSAYLSRVGALIETPAFYPALTGVENLRLFATVGGHNHERIPELMRQVRLSGREGDRFRNYSLGMKQRLGLAAVLLGDPELLILDEPSNGLDPEGVREMRTLISDIAGNGRTVLVSSHNLGELEQLCDWLVLIEKGRSLYQGPARALLHTVPRLGVAAQHRDDHGRLNETLHSHGHAVEEQDGQLVVDVGDQTVTDLAAAVNQIAFEAGIVLAELTPIRNSLEDIYLSLVHGGPQ